MEDKLKRVFSGFFLTPVIVAILLYATLFWLFALTYLVTLLTLSEYRDMAIPGDRGSMTGRVWLLTGSLFPVAAYLGGTGLILPLLLASVLLVFAVSMATCSGMREGVEDVSRKVLGIVYIALPLSFAVPLRGVEAGNWWILFVLTVIWSNDTFAYYAGRAVGRRRLSPFISPNKTVEGSVGGLAGALMAGLLFNSVFRMGMEVHGAALFALLLGLMGIVGDLAESLLKRAAGVKDSGSIIPGHGGMLDRLDSLIFAVPFAYYFVRWQA